MFPITLIISLPVMQPPSIPSWDTHIHFWNINNFDPQAKLDATCEFECEISCFPIK